MPFLEGAIATWASLELAEYLVRQCRASRPGAMFHGSVIDAVVRIASRKGR